jgi:hypothetical protein
MVDEDGCSIPETPSMTTQQVESNTVASKASFFFLAGRVSATIAFTAIDNVTCYNGTW